MNPSDHDAVSTSCCATQTFIIKNVHVEILAALTFTLSLSRALFKEKCPAKKITYKLWVTILDLGCVLDLLNLVQCTKFSTPLVDMYYKGKHRNATPHSEHVRVASFRPRVAAIQSPTVNTFVEVLPRGTSSVPPRSVPPRYWFSVRGRTRPSLGRLQMYSGRRQTSMFYFVQPRATPS